MKLHPAALAIAAVLAVVTSPPAPAQLFGDNEARKAILDLRTKVSDLEKQLMAKDAELTSRAEAGQKAQLDLLNRIESLKAEIATLRGANDALANEVAKMQRASKDLYTDLDTRLKNLEPKAVTVDGRPASIDRGEQSAYDTALGQFRAGDYKGAIVAFQSFIARYPSSALAPLAQYWTGNSYYALKEWRNAITAQQTVVDRYADSPRVPDALLNIAASQVELNDRARARQTLQRITKDFPDSEAAKAAAERLKSLGNGK